MVVRNAGEHAHFVEFHVPRKGKILLVGARPGSDLRELVAHAAANLYGLAVALRIEEEFGSRNEASPAAQAVEEFEHLLDLGNSVGRTRLLTVTEGRVRDVHLLCRMRGKHYVVKGCAADLGIGIELAVQLRLCNVLQGKVVQNLGVQKGHVSSERERRAFREQFF